MKDFITCYLYLLLALIALILIVVAVGVSIVIIVNSIKLFWELSTGTNITWTIWNKLTIILALPAITLFLMPFVYRR